MGRKMTVGCNRGPAMGIPSLPCLTPWGLGFRVTFLDNQKDHFLDYCPGTRLHDVGVCWERVMFVTAVYTP